MSSESYSTGLEKDVLLCVKGGGGLKQLNSSVRCWSGDAKRSVPHSFYTGSIIRCMRRLEELLRQMCQAAKAIGNTELENKFAEGRYSNSTM